jgi:hypothetical protein
MSDFSDLVTSLPGLVQYNTMEGMSGAAQVGVAQSIPSGAGVGSAVVSGGGGSVNFTSATGSSIGTTITFPKPQSAFVWARFGAMPASGIKVVGGWNTSGLYYGIRNNSRLYNLGTNTNSPEILAVGKTYFFGWSYADGEVHFYLNGRWMRNDLQTWAASSAIWVVGDSNQNMVIGHTGIFNRALSNGEFRALYRAGAGPSYPYPNWTDPYDLQADGDTDRVATIDHTPGDPMFAGKGRRITADSPRPSLAAPIVGNNVVKAHNDGTYLYCAGKVCGGRIRPNEGDIIWLPPIAPSVTPRPIHVACLRIDKPGTTQPKISAISGSPTAAQWQAMFTRLLRDQLAWKTIKTIGDGTISPTTPNTPGVAPTGTGGHWLAINERAHEQSPAGSYWASNFSTPDIPNTASIDIVNIYAEACVAAALLHRYYKLPTNSWTRKFCEMIIDHLILQLQANNGSIQDGGGNDFIFPCFGMTVKLMGPYLTAAKYATWKNALVLLAENTVGFFPGYDPAQHVRNGLYCINSNRNLQNMFGIWMTYLVTGNDRWRRVFEMQYQIFCGGMPAVGGKAAAPARGAIGVVPSPPASGIAGAVTGDWDYGATTNVWNGQSPQTEPPSLPYGFYTVIAPTLADGSDGVGYLSEAPSPGGPATGPDQNYLAYMLTIIVNMLPWTNYDPRFVYIANMMLGYLWPFIDQIGGRIYVQDDAAHGIVGGSLQTDSYAGTWSLDVQGGVRYKGYSAQLFSQAVPYALWVNGLRSGKPPGTPAPIHPGGYGPDYYSAYEILTEAHIKAQYSAVEAYYNLQMTQPQEPNRWRELGKNLTGFLSNDPNFDLPTTPGLS